MMVELNDEMDNIETAKALRGLVGYAVTLTYRRPAWSEAKVIDGIVRRIDRGLLEVTEDRGHTMRALSVEHIGAIRVDYEVAE